MLAQIGMHCIAQHPCAIAVQDAHAVVAGEQGVVQILLQEGERLVHTQKTRYNAMTRFGASRYPIS